MAKSQTCKEIEKIYKIMNPWLIKKITFPLYEKKKDLKILKRLYELETTEKYSSDQLRDIQWIKLEKLLRHCYENVEYYRNLFDSLSMRPSDIRNPEDLSQLPILTKSDIQKNLKQLVAEDKHRPYYVRRTSGSTGVPLVTYIDKNAFSSQVASQYRGRSWWGWNIGDKYAMIWGGIVHKKALKRAVKNYVVENKIFLSAFNLTEETMQNYFIAISRFKPKFIYGYPSAIFTLAQFLNENRLILPEIKIHGISTTAEILYDYQRNLIESAFGCPVINEYGSAEVGIISFECPQGGIHLTAENLMVEFIHDRSDYLSKPGDILITDLNNNIMPLLRYKIGDIGTADNKICSCGRGLPLMNISVGRECDMVVLNNGKWIHPAVFGYMGKMAISHCNGKIKKFKVIQKSVDHFLIKIVIESSCRSVAIDFFTKAFQKQFGEQLRLDFQFVDFLAREKSGKLRYFVSEISNAN